MECKITCSDGRSRRKITGASVVEFIIAMAVGLLVLTAVCAFSMFSGRSIASFANYSEIDQKNRQTMDQMAKDFRSVTDVTTFSSNSITCVDVDGTTISYTYDSGNQVLTRSRVDSSATLSTAMLANCNRFTFSMKTRNITNGSFDFYPATNRLVCKAVTAEWCCFRQVLGIKSDDLPQTITVMMRNR